MSSPPQHKPPALPNKLFFRIGEVSRLTKLEPYVLRYWETEFPHIRPEKGKSGQRLYKKKDLENILRVKHLLYEEGYTISGARKKLNGGRSSEDMATVIESAKKELREILEILN